MFSLLTLIAPLFLITIVTLIASLFKIKLNKLPTIVLLLVLGLIWTTMVFVANPIEDYYNDILLGKDPQNFITYMNYFTILYSICVTGVFYAITLILRSRKN
jgi:hypothetical protein